jgi:transcriptional regulator with XRE-family HTH domain
MSRYAERNMSEEIGEKIKKARKEKKLSLAELGSMVNVSTSYICRIENGDRNCVSLNILKQIAAALEIDFGELIEDDTIKKDTEWKKFVFEIFQKTFKSSLTESQKLEQIKIIVESLEKAREKDLSQFILT